MDIGNISSAQVVASSLTYSHNSNGDGLIVRVSAWGDPGRTISGVTYAGSALTRIGTDYSPDGFYVVGFFKHTSPTAGANNVVVTASGSADITSGALSLTDSVGFTHSASLANATGTTTTPSVAVTSVSGDLVLDNLSWFTSPLQTTNTEGAGQTRDYSIAASGIQHGAGSRETATGASTTMSHTVGSNIIDWSISGIAITPPVAAGIAIPIITRQFRARSS